MDRGHVAIATALLLFAGTGCNDAELDALPSSHTETHYQGAEQPPVDVLFVIDNSGSMEREQQKLGENFEAFISHFVALDLDFHLGVTTTDVDDPGHRGRFQGAPPILTAQTPQLANVFLQNVSVGTDGSGAETGLEAMRLALSPENLTGPNQGFLREDAILAVIIVSDEEDWSDGDDNEPDPASAPPVSEYVSFLLALKGGDPSKVTMPVIVGDVPGGCETTDAEAEAGVRYHEAAAALNGSKSSICTEDFATVLDLIGASLAGLVTAFPLEYTPDPETITVRVDGEIVPRDPENGWYWDSLVGGVAFAPPALPPSCAVVEISYGVVDHGGPLQEGNAEAPPEQCPVAPPPLAATSLEGGYFACTVARGATGGSAGGCLALLVLGLGCAWRRRAG